MTKKELAAASNADVLDWLCYACWDFERKCARGEREKEKALAHIGQLKTEVARRMNGKD